MKFYSSLETLENRIAPASLLFKSPTTATYTDSDGDLVTVKFSKGILSDANVATVLVMTPIDATHDQLQRIDLTVAGLAVPAAGTKITVTVTPQLPGDGFANVGYINATGLDLGAVTIRGDLGAIDAGDATTKTPGLKGLTVQSFGVLGTATGAPDLQSNIVGTLSKLTVEEDMQGARLEVSGGKDGKLPSVTIAGSLVGGSLVRSGTIHTTGDLGTVKIGVDLQGGSADLVGNGQGAGSLLSDGKIGSVTIGGQLFGGGYTGVGEAAGTIKSGGDMGAISIGTDLFGGIGDGAGSIISGGKLASVKIGGRVQGSIVLIGAGTPHTGYIGSAGDMGKITIQGNLTGTFNPYAGTIESGGKIASVTINGDMFGGDHHSGSILAAKTIGPVKIGGTVSGGNGDFSGSIISSGDLPSITIGGGLAGGRANKTGIISGLKLGTIKIGGSLSGGNSSGAFSFSDSGEVIGNSIASLTIGGSFSGGSAGNQTLARVGFISATTIIKSLTINGDIFGGSISGTGSVTDSASISADQIGKIVVNGSISSGGFGSGSNGTLARSGAIMATHDIASIKVKGNIEGAEDGGKGAAPIQISAVGQLKPTAAKDLAIGSITVGGHVSLLDVLAGYTPAKNPVNGGAQIGTVTVTGSWTQSNLVAGAMNAASTNKNFGDANDTAIATGSAANIAKITAIKIGGIIGGTPSATNPDDHYGFVAHTIAGFFIGGTKIVLPVGPIIQDVGATEDVSVHLI